MQSNDNTFNLDENTELFNLEDVDLTFNFDQTNGEHSQSSHGIDLVKGVKQFNEEKQNNSFNYSSQSAGSREMARKLLIDCLKMGDDRFRNLVRLLLDCPGGYSSQENKRVALFLQNQERLKKNKFNILFYTLWLNLLKDSQEFIKNNHDSFMDASDYYTQLGRHLSTVDISYLRNDFDNIIDMYKDNQAKERYWQQCLMRLSRSIPKTSQAARYSRFALVNFSKESFKLLIQQLEKLTKEVEKARDNAQEIYQLADDLIALHENRIKGERQTLIKSILQTGNNEIESGIPYNYKGLFSKKALENMSGTVPLNAIESETGSTLALIALQYQNLEIYNELFYCHKDLTNTAAKNSKGLSAENYDAAFLVNDKSLRNNSRVIIQNCDADGEILRKMEKSIRQYLQEWDKKNYHLQQQDPNLLEKGRSSLIKFFNDPNLFIQRHREANEYLALIQDALKGNPAGFYTEFLNILQNSNRGALGGSKLHAMHDGVLYKNN